MDVPIIIPDRAEFVDALRLLLKGRVLVRAGEGPGRCVLDGEIVYRSYDTLLRYGLIREFDNPEGFPQFGYYRLTDRGREFDNPEGFPQFGYYRLTDRGREFATRACTAWRRRPLWQRLAVRLTG